MNQTMNSYMPVRLITGEGCVRKNGQELVRLGKKALLVTGMHSARACGALDDVTAVLETAGIEYTVFDAIRQNPAWTDCMRAAAAGAEQNCDFVIGIGGGSPLDAAKCIAVLTANPGMTREELYRLDWPGRPLPIAVIGTTAGTGSEVTKVSVITLPDGRKKSFHHEAIFPAVAFGDPRYTMSLPETVTASTAIDALAHATESYFSRKANEISRCYCVRAIRLLWPQLCKMADGRGAELSYEDREALYHGSIYGGLAINITGTCFPHTMGYLLTEQHQLPHGFACAMFLPEFLNWNEQEMPELAALFFDEIGCEPKAFHALIRHFLKAISVTVTEEEIAREHSRWIGNGSIANSWGNLSPELCDEMLRRLGTDARLPDEVER